MSYATPGLPTGVVDLTRGVELRPGRGVRAELWNGVRHRAQEDRAAQLGLTVDQLRRATATAAGVWHSRPPWRWLPAPVRWALFPWLGRRFVGRFVTQWIHSAHNAGGDDA